MKKKLTVPEVLKVIRGISSSNNSISLELILDNIDGNSASIIDCCYILVEKELIIQESNYVYRLAWLFNIFVLKQNIKAT